MTRLGLPNLNARLICIIVVCVALVHAPVAQGLAEQVAATPRQNSELSPALRQALQSAGNRVTNEVLRQYAIDVRTTAQRQLAAENVHLPAEFQRQVDSHPATRQAVYLFNGPDAGEMLKQLYALQLDLGPEKFWQYIQLAIAGAVVNTARQVPADLESRPPVHLLPGGDPRVKVDTKDPKRKLDRDDHIINFLDDHTIEEDVVVGSAKDHLPELKYDNDGVAIPQLPDKKGKPQAVQRRTRPLIAADVIASRALQQQFNDYMASKGYPQVKIDCGDQVVSWNSRNAVQGSMRKQIAAASQLFQEAYEAKGRLPAEPDPQPTMGELCAYLIRNHEYTFTAEQNKTRQWPRYPLTADWPTLLFLVSNNQSLREREERWIAFRDQGEMKTYGEYIGGIAQQFDMQSARRLSPYPYAYGTIQMMFKDGGVCGTMANIGVRTYCTLGMPACTAGQPGHCALVRFVVDQKSGTYDLVGGQYATGGDDKTTPHAPLFFCFGGPRLAGEQPHDIKQRFPMFAHKAVAWSTNQGMPEFARSVAAWHIGRLLLANHAEDQARHVFASGITANPYLFPLVQSQIRLLASPERATSFWTFFEGQLAGHSAGGPTNSLYRDAIAGELMKKLNDLPSPKDSRQAQAGLDFLNTFPDPNGTLLAKYSLATHGMDQWSEKLDLEISRHAERLATEQSAEIDAQANRLSKMIAETIAQSKDPQDQRLHYTMLMAGNELYFDERTRLIVHPAFAMLNKQAKRKVDASDYYPAIMSRLRQQLQSQADPMYLKDANLVAAKIKEVAGKLNDEKAKQDWLKQLTTLAQKHPQVLQTKGKSVTKRPNPCLATLQQLSNG